MGIRCVGTAAKGVVPLRTVRTLRDFIIFPPNFLEKYGSIVTPKGVSLKTSNQNASTDVLFLTRMDSVFEKSDLKKIHPRRLYDHTKREVDTTKHNAEV